MKKHTLVKTALFAANSKNLVGALKSRFKKIEDTAKQTGLGPFSSAREKLSDTNSQLFRIRHHLSNKAYGNTNSWTGKKGHKLSNPFTKDDNKMSSKVWSLIRHDKNNTGFVPRMADHIKKKFNIE